MLFWTILLITFSVGLETVDSQISCGRDEIWTDCVNSCNTCEQKGSCIGKPVCRPGCDCKYGFLRDENGICVPNYECEDMPFRDQKCPENSVFLQCGSACPPSCENPIPGECEEECVSSCQCRPGFLRRADGKCVRQELCYARDLTDSCGKDEEYYEDCTPSCKNTCENIGNSEIRCNCGPPGCFCKEGLVKGGDGKCVPPYQCSTPSSGDSPTDKSSKCPPNAVFIPCGSACPPTCENMQPDPCEEKCTTACYCKPGYLKSRDGRCVRPQHCNTEKNKSPQCPENAIFIECGSACPPTCENRFPEPCEEKCTTACYCKPGYLKSQDNRCVLPQSCNLKKNYGKCQENEQYYPECAPSCKNTCENYTNPSCQCATRGCFCKEGLLKRADGECVTSQQCAKAVSNNPQTSCNSLTEEYLECGTTCPDTCENKGRTTPNNCPRRCIKGCFCKKGLFRTREGACVAWSDCPTAEKTSEKKTTSQIVTETVPITEDKAMARHGCPNVAACDSYCKKVVGKSVGYCSGPKQWNCRCMQKLS